MSDGDDAEDAAPDGEPEPEPESESTELDVPDEEALREALDDAEAALADAETEADLDEVEATLDGVAEDLDAATLPGDDADADDADDADDEETVREELEGRLSDLRDDLEAQRGPYAEDVVDEVEAARATVADTRWTERGRSEVREAVSAFVDEAAATLDVDLAVRAVEDGPAGDGDDEGGVGEPPWPAEAALLDALDDVAAATTDAGLDPDDDAETIAALLEATDALATALEDAEEWDDLEVREQLVAEGFFDVLGHYKDFPPELSAIKEHESRGNVEMIVLAMEKLGSEFMIDHCVDALTRMNDDRAFEAMHRKAQRRDKAAIRALGKMAAADAVDTLVEYVDADKDPGLQKVTFKALGEIGDEAATQALANKLAMDNDQVRPHAARALGLLGDTRAVEPLIRTLEDDEVDGVRAAAAWALRQIGTEAALEAAAEHADDRSFLVAHEADLAAETLDAGADTGREAPPA